jgi:orotate phosphoribosyltransferase/AMMECR1 domain-containing protein
MTTTESSSRERLRELLRSGAIVYGNAGQPIVDHLGQPMTWIFYSWGITLSHEGGNLAGDCLLDALRQFDSTQIAGVGMTGLPLVSSIVSRGQGRYTGLYIRDQQEQWGTRRQVEGVGNRNMPVVVVDDCVCSGRSLKRAFTALEHEGYTIEGALCLVNFRWKGGTEWVQALGYRMETVFDVWNDLDMLEVQDIPSYWQVRAEFDADSLIPDGSSPADAAHRAAIHFLNYGLLPSPPKSFDHEYESSGGVVVSFRDRRSDFRVARDGFYHVDASEANLGRDVLLATAKALLSSRGAVAQYGLSNLKVAVTLFGEQVPTSYRDLDFSRFGVLIQSKVRPWRIASALPNTQFFISEIEQLRHARFTNARLFAQEPFEMYRHVVTKSVQSKCTWPTFGVSVTEDGADHGRMGEILAARVREVLVAVSEGCEVKGGRLSSEVFRDRIDGLAVTLYNGGMIGCWVSLQPDLDDMIREATAGAWQDRRWERKDSVCPADIDIAVSVFQLAEVLGFASTEYVAFKLRLGKDTLAVSLDKDSKRSFLLSYIPCLNSWSKREAVEGALRKAGFSGPSFYWTTYRTQSWVDQSGAVKLLEYGYPKRSTEERFEYRETLGMLASYLADKIGPSGLPNYCYFPVSNRTIMVKSAPRVVLALDALLEAASILDDSRLQKAAIFGLRVCCDYIVNDQDTVRLDLPERSCGATAEVFLINALYRSNNVDLIKKSALERLLTRLQGYFHSDGVISWQKPGMRLESDHDLFPGSALLMAALVAKVRNRRELSFPLVPCLTWYQKRFRLLHPWGMVFWQTQGWAALFERTGERCIADFVFELADWAVESQLDKNGAFLVDYAPDGPGFHTACVLEALADAWSVARQVGDSEREQKYHSHWLRGIDFVNTLIIREEDCFAMPEPSKAIGGVRESLTNSTVRIDYVAHSLLALVKGISYGIV